MAFPPLRRPKAQEKQETPSVLSETSMSNLILTLKNDRKLVVSSDAYNGILKHVTMYECVFCDHKMPLDPNLKELHKRSQKHRDMMNTLPFIEGFAENLVKQISRDQAHCTICHAVVSIRFLSRHISSEYHVAELEKSLERGRTYKPFLTASKTEISNPIAVL